MPGLIFFIFIFYFSKTESHSIAQAGGAVGRSRLTATPAARVQAILVSQPPEYLGLQAPTITPG